MDGRASNRAHELDQSSVGARARPVVVLDHLDECGDRDGDMLPRLLESMLLPCKIMILVGTGDPQR